MRAIMQADAAVVTACFTFDRLATAHLLDSQSPASRDLTLSPRAAAVDWPRGALPGRLQWSIRTHRCVLVCGCVFSVWPFVWFVHLVLLFLCF